jgi:hypothetical protein
MGHRGKMRGRRTDTREEVEIAYTEEDTGGSIRRALEGSTGAQVRLLAQGKEWGDEERVWEIHDRIGASPTCIAIKERVERVRVRTRCGEEQWSAQAERRWSEADLIRELMPCYRPVAHQAPSLLVFDENDKRRREYALEENWEYVLCVGEGKRKRASEIAGPDGSGGDQKHGSAGD